MTDTSTLLVRPTTSWQHRSLASTAAELLLGLSFVVTVAFAGWGAATGHTSPVAQLGAVVFLVTLTVVLVNWFTQLEVEDAEGR